MIDLQARAKLQSNQQTKAITEGIEKLTAAIKTTNVATPQSPATDVATELRNLQKMIGGGNLTESLARLAKSLDTFDVNESALTQLKSLIADLSAKLIVLAQVEAKLPKDINLNFPEDVTVHGKVDVGTIDSLPPVQFKNLDELTNSLSILINNLQMATIKAIQASKTEFPKQFQVGEVTVSQFADLLDGIEELKKGFNLLLKKEAATVSFPSTSIPVEVQNWKVAQPVTHVSVNSLKGILNARPITVTSTAAKIPPDPLAYRRTMIIYNNDATTTLYIGGSTVSTGTGFPIPPSTYSPPIDAGPLMDIYGVVDSGSIIIRLLEVSDEDSGR
jgi:hypothetical protein